MFFQETGDDSCYRIGKVTIDQSMHTQSADEAFFSYFCNDALYSITRTIHKDDLDDFEKTIHELGENDIRYRLIRMKGADDEYRWMIVKMSYNLQMMSKGLRYIDIIVKDIIKLEKSTVCFENIIDSFRYILSVQESIIFEYNNKTNRFIIYSFDYNSNTIFLNEDFDYFKYHITSAGKISPDDTDIFLEFCENVKRGESRFQFEMSTDILTNDKNFQLQIFNGFTVSYGIEMKTVLGTISLKNNINDISSSGMVLETNLDPLTKLLNKKAVSYYAAEKIETGIEDSVIIAIIDIDDFKYINDSYGHMFGDEILCTVSGILKREIGSKGVAGRIGGDEFMMIIENIKDETELRSILRAVRSNVEIMCAEKMEGLHVTCSMGTAEYPKNADTYEKLFKTADKALYIAKERGKNRYIIYDPKKHGTLNGEELSIDTEKSKDGTLSKVSVVGDMMIDILSEKKLLLSEIIKRIGCTFQTDSVNIFWGDDMRIIYSWSAAENTALNAQYIFSGNYINNFNQDKIFIIDNVNILEGRNSGAYDFLIRNNICAAVQYLITDNENIIGMISFDLIGHYKKWSKSDVSYMYMLARAISNKLINDKNNGGDMFG